MPRPEDNRVSQSLEDLDRRSADRVPAAGGVRLTLSGELPEGRLRDRSPSGVFVELDGSLELVLEFHDTAGPSRRRARLVRAQALAGQRSGWALEFTDSDACGR